MIGQTGDEIFLCGCARNYSGAQLIAPIPYPNLIPIRDPFSVGYWVDELHGSYVSKILRL